MYPHFILSLAQSQQRQLSLISEYVTSLNYIRGPDNVVADCLSRPVCAASNVDIFDLHGLAESQKSDNELESLKYHLIEFNINPHLKLWCDHSTPTPRPYVPFNQRIKVIDFLHKLSHPNIKTTTKLVKQRYYFPNIDKLVKEYVGNCVDCQRVKVGVHTKSPIEAISSPTDRFQTVHIDLITLPPVYSPSLPSSLPFRYALTCIDRATRWYEAIPLIDTSAITVATAFLSGWISRFGVPLHVVTDRGAQFESEFFLHLSQLVGFHHIRTTSYHPQSNGFIERLHRTLKTALMARDSNWYLSLPIVLLGLRMSPNSLNYSPFTAVTGTHMLCPHSMITKDNTIDTQHDTLKLFIKEMQSINFYDFSSGNCHTLPNNSYIPHDLHTVPQVWLRVDRVRRSLEAPYSGPYDVIKRYPKYFVLKLPQGETSVSIDRLKPARFSSKPKPPSTPLLNSNPIPSTSTDPSPVPSCPPLVSEPPAPENVVTRSGRTVRFNVNPEYQYF